MGFDLACKVLIDIVVFDYIPFPPVINFSFTNVLIYFIFPKKKVLFKMDLVQFCTKRLHFTLQAFRNNSDLV